MDIEIARKINIDFYETKYIQVNAKQYDKKSRFILITCYNQGTIYRINKEYNFAYIRYRKSDNLGVFNSCEITDDGKIFVELTEQMLAVPGKCYADLVVVHNESNENSNIEIVDGEIIIDNNSKILSTMIFCINVVETSLSNSEIESSYEYNALNELIEKVTNDYVGIIDICKTSEENAKQSEENAKQSEINSKTSEDNAKTYADNAKASEDNAKISEENAKLSETNASISESNAKISEDNAKASEENAKISENIALSKATEASQYAIDANESATIASDKATESINYAKLSQSYAVGGTDSRTNEDSDNSKYYYDQIKTISSTFGGVFVPMGTIQFSELQSVEKEAGYVYHITDSFITDDTFKCGAGVSCSVGTNVYYTADGYWDYFVHNSLSVYDDGDGNVFIECNYASIEDYQPFIELKSRVDNIESSTVLEVDE